MDACTSIAVGAGSVVSIVSVQITELRDETAKMKGMCEYTCKNMDKTYDRSVASLLERKKKID